MVILFYKLKIMEMRIFRLLVIMLALLTLNIACDAGESLILAENGRSDYSIVISSTPSDSSRYAAAELKKFIKKMTGAELPIISAPEPENTKLILLGDSKRLRELEIKLDIDSLGADGYIIRTKGSYLIIAGSAVRGNLYGVYGLLEDHFGCHWFTPEVSRIPFYKKLEISDIEEQQIPVLKERDVYIYECFDSDWCARNRLAPSYPLADGKNRLEKRHGGEKTYWAKGFAGHTFRVLVPPEKYFSKHPEYFSLVNGKRLRDRTQLCPMNEDVIRICTERILDEMRKQPDAKIFMVDHGVKGIFEQGSSNTPHAELAALEGYMIAKFLWNADYDQDKALGDFLEVYYGNAAEDIREYISLFYNEVEQRNIHIGLFTNVRADIHNVKLLSKANEIMSKAEQHVAADPERLVRVRNTRMCVDYAILERSRYLIEKGGGKRQSYC